MSKIADFGSHLSANGHVPHAKTHTKILFLLCGFTCILLLTFVHGVYVQHTHVYSVVFHCVTIPAITLALSLEAHVSSSGSLFFCRLCM
jgi:hypothetical protein